MANTMHINTSLKLPRAPKRPSCFAGNTVLILDDGRFIAIKDVRVGDILAGGNKVTAKLTLSATNVNMCNIRGDIVSDDHLVMVHHAVPQWCRVDHHPEAYDATIKGSVIYCLNTMNKTIKTANGNLFCDWDELVTMRQRTHFIECFKTAHPDVTVSADDIANLGNLTQTLDEGFSGDTDLVVGTIGRTIIKVPLSHVRLGDILYMNSAGDLTGVYGIVEVNNGMHILTYDGCFMIATNKGVVNCSDYNNCIDRLIGKQANDK